MPKLKNGKRVSEAVQLLMQGAKEPSFTALTSETSDMHDAFNYYNEYAKKELSKISALKWAEENEPELVKSLRNEEDNKFSNIGLVCRMQERGFVLSDKHKKNIRDFLISLANTKDKDKDKETEKKIVVKKQKLTLFNTVLEQLDYSIDDLLSGKTPRSFDKGTDKEHLEEVLDCCEKITEEIRNDIEDAYDKKKATQLKKHLALVKADVENVLSALKQNKVKVSKPKKLNPYKMTAKLQYKKEDVALGLVSVNPELLIGAKLAVVYNTEFRTLMIYRAASESGFMVSGSSLKNFDIEKSILKKIRKPEELKTMLNGATLTEIKKYLDNIKGKEFVCKGRFNEHTIIVRV
jgi:hypothetical protein